ncbi:MAG: acetyl-CoA carboxylase carboxyltransferase subunit alpha [Tenericutes bacterium]|nr:acetyl-CoA carboxylase carboxyltransferase subunit alpha [Mycoplasmatota bacterium]
MNIKESEVLIKNLEAEKANIEDTASAYYMELNKQIRRIKKEAFNNLTAWDKVYLARRSDRPKAQDYIELLFDNFYELHGDRGVRDDKSLIGGICYFEGTAVTVLAQSKGKDMQSNIDRNFGMMNPEGYRKALRLAKQAEKFNRPIINIVDTPGAFPGKEAEERGQAEAIAQCLFTFSNLKVPIISIVIGEGGSGGALALSVADRLVMLENSIYSILSPEGFASILWKDETRAKEAAEIMKLTAKDLLEKNIIDEIIKEPLGGAQECIELVAENIRSYISQELTVIKEKKIKDLLEERYNKTRKVGSILYEK